MDEFELIDRYFRPLSTSSLGLDLGIGDDAAVLTAPGDHQLVVTTDTHVESVHFPYGSTSREIAFRSCATSLSDLAAMGASACWASLALTTMDSSSTWFEGFALGVNEALTRCGASLVGGDTTRGPLVVTWNIIGIVPVGAALLRSGASPGDSIYVSGTLGSSAAALELSLVGSGDYSELETELRNRYWYPQPRFDFADLLHSVASACIDISDGLIADLTHLARSSNCGAVIECHLVPLARGVIELLGAERGLQSALSGGDDYELCFTVPQERETDLMRKAETMDLSVIRIGRMVEGQKIRAIDGSGRPISVDHAGYRHFEECS